MSVTVGAALKKIAVALLTNPKVIKTIGGIVLGIIIIIIMPIVAVVSIFNGGIDLDTDRLQLMVVENLSAEEQAKLQLVEDTMLSIESEMKAAGFSGRVKEAQVLYALILSEHAVYIDTSGYTDPTTKNNLDLVQWAIEAEKSGWGYVWGTYGDVFDQEMFDFKLNQYPDEVGGYEEFIRQNWLGGRTADCVGLIKGYGWLNADSHEVEYGINGMPDIGADTMYENATEKGTIDTIPEIPGLAVWHQGHIGIYIGNGEVVQAANTKAGVIRNKLEDTAWTHWLKIPYINYVEKQEESQ